MGSSLSEDVANVKFQINYFRIGHELVNYEYSMIRDSQCEMELLPL